MEEEDQFHAPAQEASHLFSASEPCSSLGSCPGRAPVPYVRYQLYPPEEKQGSCYSRPPFLVLVVGGLAWGALTLFNSCSAQSVELLAEGQEATITVAEGAGAKVVGEQLAGHRLVSNAGDFTKRVNEMGVDSQLKPGT